MKFKKITAMATALAMFGTVSPFSFDVIPQTVIQANAEETKTYTDSNGLQLEYNELDDGTIEITKYVTSTSTDIELPSIIDGKQVTSIGMESFYNCNLTSIVIPNGVNNIDYYAFGSCKSLTSVKIPNTVNSIKGTAFQGCTALKSINIPDSIKSIEYATFFYCTSLTEIKIPDSVSTIASEAFGSCTSLTSVTIPNGVTEIGYGAFHDCTSLKTVSIADSVNIMDGNVFEGCTELTSIKLPNNIEKIGYGLFSGCTSLETISIPETVSVIESNAFSDTKWLDNKKKESPFVVVNKILIDGQDCNGDIVIPDDVKIINESAFNSCENITSVTIPDSVTIIGSYAFYNCKNLSAVKIPESIIKVGLYAFEGSLWLETKKSENSLVIESGIVFDGTSCTGDVVIPDGVRIIGDDAFISNNELISLTLPESVTRIGNATFAYCSSLESVVGGENITVIENQGFGDCTSLKSITLGKKLESIGDYAFSYHLDDFVIYGYADTFAESYAKDNYIAFYRLDDDTLVKPTVSGVCGDNLTWVLDENGKLSISGTGDMYEFERGKNSADTPWKDYDIYVNSLDIGEGVSSIANDAFAWFRHITEVNIPSSVNKIDYQAFYWCENLNSVTIKNPDCEIDDSFMTICNNYDNDCEYTGVIKGYTNSTAQAYAEKYDRTFGAIDEETPEPVTDVKFVDGINNWSFANSSRNFGSGYYISDDYLDKLLDGLSRTEQWDIKCLLNDEFGGSCYGMASTSILSCYGILDPADYQTGANFLHDINSPPTNDVKSLINYYFALQVTDYVYQNTTQALYYKTEQEKIQTLISQVTDGTPTLLTFFLGYGGGHAVVAYGIEYGSYVYDRNAYNAKIIIYDNNAVDFDNEYCMYINTSNNSWIIPHYSGADTNKGATLGMTTDDLDIINYHGYLDGTKTKSWDEYISILSSKAIASNFSLRKISMGSKGWTVNAGSEDDIKMFSSFTADTDSADVKFAIKGSNSGCVMEFNKAEDVDMSMRYENDLISVDFASANDVVFDPSGYLEVSGENSAYTFDMVSNDGYAPTDWYDMTVLGTGASVVFKKVDNGYTLKSDNLQNIVVSAESDNANPSCKFSTDYTEVLIYEIDENTIGIAVDTDYNGTYETNLETESATIAGDANGDGKVSLADAVTVLQYIANSEKYPLSEQAKESADVYNKGDGITAMDALTIQQYDSGQIDSF